MKVVNNSSLLTREVTAERGSSVTRQATAKLCYNCNGGKMKTCFPVSNTTCSSPVMAAIVAR